VPRKFFNDGQFIQYSDFNLISTALEKELYDRILFRLLGSQENKVFDNSFYVSYVSATQVSVAAGLGFQTGDAADTEPEKRLLYKASATTKTVAAADPTNPRIDIVCIKHNRATTVTELRDFKDATDGSVSSQSMAVQKDWDSDLLVVTGTPAGSPSAPSTPSGYIKLCEITVPASTGPTSQSNISDKRLLFSTFGVDKNFVLANNQSSAADVKGALFTGGLFRSVTIDYDIYRQTGTALSECREVGRLILIWSHSESIWRIERIADAVQNNDTGIVFSMSGNQLQYTSTNISGASYSGLLTYRVRPVNNP
jgi:hypothetical protein